MNSANNPLAPLAGLKQLKKVELLQTAEEFSGSDLKHLVNSAETLTELTVQGENPREVFREVANFPRLRVLRVCVAGEVSDWSKLAQCKRLEKLERCYVTINKPECFAPLNGLSLDLLIISQLDFETAINPLHLTGLNVRELQLTLGKPDSKIAIKKQVDDLAQLAKLRFTENLRIEGALAQGLAISESVKAFNKTERMKLLSLPEAVKKVNRHLLGDGSIQPRMTSVATVFSSPRVGHKVKRCF
jgi:hypothetical protein